MLQRMRLLMVGKKYVKKRSPPTVQSLVTDFLVILSMTTVERKRL
jgi:hypothetical protein